jgi:hypothetical protein
MRFLIILVGIPAAHFCSSAFVSPAMSDVSSPPTATATIRPKTIRCNTDATAPTGKPRNDAASGGGGDIQNIFDSFLSSIFNNGRVGSSSSSPNGKGINGGRKSLAARSLLLSLINDDGCFSTVDGARKFARACAVDVVYEDCHASSKPIVGRSAVEEHLASRALARTGIGGGAEGAPGFRIDRISDGSAACGFAWTWTSPSSSLEGLRGTTFVELDPATNEIRYVREIPEPLYKPGNLIIDLLKAATANAVPRPPPQFVRRTPTSANEIAKYLFNDLQGSDSTEAMRFFDEGIVYRDFNFDEVLRGKEEVKKFIDGECVSASPLGEH